MPDEPEVPNPDLRESHIDFKESGISDERMDEIAIAIQPSDRFLTFDDLVRREYDKEHKNA